MLVYNNLIGECKAAHTGLDAQNVVVDGEQLLGLGVGVIGAGAVLLEGHGHLGIVNAREVAGAGRLVLLGMQGEGVGVDTRVRATRVVVERLHLIEVLAVLLLEAVLTVQDQLEVVQGTHLQANLWGTLLGPAVDAVGAQQNLRGTSLVGGNDGVGGQKSGRAGGYQHVGAVGGEVPQTLQVGGTGVRGGLVAPDQLLDWVVQGQTHNLGCSLGCGGHGITAGVLALLNQVLVCLLCESAALLGVEEHVVGPDDRGVGAKVSLVVGGTVNVQSHLVVLQGNQRQVQAWVAVEEEQQGQVHLVGVVGAEGTVGPVGQGGHLVVVDLVVAVQEQLRVQTPPDLVVLVDALATDGQLNSGECTLGNPVGVKSGVAGCQVRLPGGGGLQLGIHVTNQVTVAGNGYGDALGVGHGTVDGLLNSLHGKVGVALVHSLEEGNLGVTSQIHILSTVGNELHKTTSHFDISQEKN